jgi:predicted amidophosphoribosyltransferase
MLCSNCKNPIPDNSETCEWCGKSLVAHNSLPINSIAPEVVQLSESTIKNEKQSLIKKFFTFFDEL